jgi:hypothetical protein
MDSIAKCTTIINNLKISGLGTPSQAHRVTHFCLHRYNFLGMRKWYYLSFNITTNNTFIQKGCVEEMPTNVNDDGGGVKFGNTWDKINKQPPHTCI